MGAVDSPCMYLPVMSNEAPSLSSTPDPLSRCLSTSTSVSQLPAARPAGRRPCQPCNAVKTQPMMTLDADVGLRGHPRSSPSVSGRPHVVTSSFVEFACWSEAPAHHRSRCSTVARLVFMSFWPPQHARLGFSFPEPLNTGRRPSLEPLEGGLQPTTCRQSRSAHAAVHSC